MFQLNRKYTIVQKSEQKFVTYQTFKHKSDKISNKNTQWS